MHVCLLVDEKDCLIPVTNLFMILCRDTLVSTKATRNQWWISWIERKQEA